MQENKQIHTKVQFLDEIRRFVFPHTSFEELTSILCNVFALDANVVLKVHFVDEENDLVTITTDEELCYAVELCPRLLRLIISQPAVVSEDHLESTILKDNLWEGGNGRRQGRGNDRRQGWGNSQGLDKSEKIARKIRNLESTIENTDSARGRRSLSWSLQKLQDKQEVEKRFELKTYGRGCGLRDSAPSGTRSGHGLRASAPEFNCGLRDSAPGETRSDPGGRGLRDSSLRYSWGRDSARGCGRGGETHSDPGARGLRDSTRGCGRGGRGRGRGRGKGKGRGRGRGRGMGRSDSGDDLANNEFWKRKHELQEARKLGDKEGIAIAYAAMREAKNKTKSQRDPEMVELLAKRKQTITLAKSKFVEARKSGDEARTKACSKELQQAKFEFKQLKWESLPQ